MGVRDRMAKFNRAVANRITRPFAARLPWFGVLHHIGRVTGKRRANPVMAWADDKSVFIPLTYGDQVDWLKNCMAAGSTIVMQGKRFGLGTAEVVDSAVAAASAPLAIRRFVQRLKLSGYARLPITDRPN